MQLFIIRHAIAAPGSAVLPDAERPLTPEGRTRFASAVVGLQRLHIRVDRLYHSPWRRAVETAVCLRPLVMGEMTSCEALARPPDTPLLALLTAETVALVGHQPWVSELTSWLVSGSRALGGHFAFKRGGVAWLEGQPSPGRMTVRALLPPKVLRGLAESGPPA